jgi:hypothetical protein
MHRPEARLSEHQVNKGGSIYYFNAPHQDNHPSLTAVKAGVHSANHVGSSRHASESQPIKPVFLLLLRTSRATFLWPC